MEETLDSYLKQQSEAVLLMPPNAKIAYFNELCRTLFSDSPKDEIWFALHCVISEQLIGKVPHLRIELDRLGQHSRTLSERVVEAMEGEQGRLSRELHDGILQCIIGARMLLERVLAGVPRETPEFKFLLDVEECLAHANQEGRRLLENLRPATIDELGLADALKLFLERMQREYGTQFELDDRCEPGTSFPPEIRCNLYRVLQEGIHNAVKHSGSSRVRVTLGQVNDEAWVRVEDWGTGFDLEQKMDQPNSNHVGLSSLRERASLLGGRCEIISQPGHGTTIEVRVPLERLLESGFSNLRTRAQAVLQRRPSDPGEEALVTELKPDEVAALLHEFEVHRMELEIQNDELRLAQAELIASRDRFRDLYEHTSLGYLELDRNGRIASVNLTLSSLLGRPRYDILDRTFDSLLDPESRGKSVATAGREVKMLSKVSPGWFWARLETRPIAGKRLQISIEDLTARRNEAEKQARLELHLELAGRKEILARRKDKVFSNLLKSLGELCSNSGIEVKDLETTLSCAKQSFIDPSPEMSTVFHIDTCLKETLSALSLTMSLDRVNCHLGAGSAELAGDPILFGILVEKLLSAAYSDSEKSRITLSTGVLNFRENIRCYLDVAESQGDPLQGYEIGRFSELEQLAGSFGATVSSFSDPGRGATVRILFPSTPVE